MYYGASEQDIRSGRVTDIYFDRTNQVLRAEGLDTSVVRLEFVAKSFPDPEWKWAVLAGVNEAMHFLKDYPVTVRAMKEGTVFNPGDPVFEVMGEYGSFLEMETPLLGFLSQASGIATRAARCKIAADGRPVASFGTRRMHASLSPVIEYAAFIGGCDGVSTKIGGDFLAEEPTGTMPHSLVLHMGDVVKAAEAYDRVIDSKVPRVVLVDGLGDERFEAVRVAKALGDRLYAVRLDTPSSRRGSMKQIAKEVRWELNLHGFNKVKICITGGIGEDQIRELNPYADYFGVGGEIASGLPLDFSANIIEVNGIPISKRGVMSGAKQVIKRDPHWFGYNGPHFVVPLDKKLLSGYRDRFPETTLLNTYHVDYRTPQQIRQYVLDQVLNMGI